MNRSQLVNARAVVVALLTGVLALAIAPAALADATYSQDLPPGGSLSTGSTVSPSDPLQLTVTAPQGGDFTIDEVTSPSQRVALPNGQTPWGWFGPQFTITPPGTQCRNTVCSQQQEQGLDQTVTVTILADAASLPAPPTLGPNPLWRPDPQAVCNSSEGASLNFCVTSKAQLAHFCYATSAPGATASCNENMTNAPQTVKPQLLSDGNVQITMQVSVAGYSGNYDAGYTPWYCPPSSADSIIVDSPSFDKGTLSDLIAHGVYYDDGCTLASTVSGEMTVTKAAAHQLHLRSNVIGRLSNGPGEGPIELTSAAKSAFRHVKHFVDLRVALQGRGAQPGQTWSDSETLHVKRPQHGSGIG